MRHIKTHRINAFFIGLMMIFSSFLAIASPATLSEIRLGKQDEKTVRVVAHLNEKNPCHIFTLQNPNRIVLDFENTVLDKKCAQNTPPATGFIKETRLGEPLPKQTRIVLETDEMPTFNEGFYLSPAKGEKEWRFVIDLKIDKSKVKSQKNSVLMPIAATSTPAKASVKKLTKPLIVLDPGHGGSDPGAISASGKYEKHLTLKIILLIKSTVQFS